MNWGNSKDPADIGFGPFAIAFSDLAVQLVVSVLSEYELGVGGLLQQRLADLLVRAAIGHLDRDLLCGVGCANNRLSDFDA